MIPGKDGFYKYRALSEYSQAAARMLEKGLSEDEIVMTLNALYWSAAECYGG